MKSRVPFLLISLIALTFSCSKNDDPNPTPTKVRYKDQVFLSTSRIDNIVYGSNVTIGGNNQTLKLDFYFPFGDTATRRPLLILVHGGAFDLVNTKSTYLIPEAEAIAKYGYAVASIDYRNYDGPNHPIPNHDLKQVIWQGVQDLKAAVRFFKDDAVHTHEYKIDPERIFISGHSSGAMVALHAGYLTDDFLADPDFHTIIQDEGGLEGNSGHPGYSSSVRGVINLAGALLDVNYIQAGAPPLKNVYGTLDNLVPFDDGIMSNVTAIAPIHVSGSNSLYVRARSLGIPASTYQIQGGDHFEPALPSCEPCLNTIASFMYSLL